MNHRIQVGIVGDYDPQRLSHLATNEALEHTAKVLNAPLDIVWIATPTPRDVDHKAILSHYDALWCAPGSPYESTEGALAAIRYAREQKVPFLGT